MDEIRNARNTNLPHRMRKSVRRGIKYSNLKRKNGQICQFCGSTNQLFLTIDHVIPHSRGGGDNEENQQVLCRLCNELKGNLTMTEFKKYYPALVTLVKLRKVKIEMVQQTFKVVLFPDGRPLEVKDVFPGYETLNNKNDIKKAN